MLAVMATASTCGLRAYYISSPLLTASQTFFFKCTFHFVINLHLLKSCTGSTESLHPVHPASLMLTPYTTMIHLSKPRNSHQHNALKKIQTHLDSTSCPKYFTFPRTLRGKHHSRHQARKEDAEAEKESMAGLWSQ